jgi:HK97 family phage prohead protease
VLNVLGRCKNGEGTLKLTKNLRDIGCECDLPKTNAGNDSLELIKRGDITGMSFAFDDDWEDSENGVSYERIEERNDKGKEVWLRHVKKVTALYDVSIVTHPAYEQTSVATREQSDAIDKAIEAQLQREHQETEEEKKAREDKEREANGGETNAEKAEREAREKQEREANGGETNAEKQAREEREKKEREAVAVMRMRRNRLALDMQEDLDNFIF